MSRRSFLASLGAVGGMEALTSRASVPGRCSETPRIRVWRSERAATYGTTTWERVCTSLERTFDVVYDGVEVTLGGVVDVPTEDGYEVFVTNGGWADMVSTGAFDPAGIDPVDGVNLLVTDGEMTTAPTGAALSGAASVGGARHLASLADVEAVSLVSRFSYPVWVLQVVVHECGHALGLAHDHGSIEVANGRAIVSPMVSSYAWARESVRERQFDHTHCACGTSYPSVDGMHRYLSLTFSPCAVERLRCWNRGVLAKHGLWRC